MDGWTGTAVVLMSGWVDGYNSLVDRRGGWMGGLMNGRIGIWIDNERMDEEIIWTDWMSGWVCSGMGGGKNTNGRRNYGFLEKRGI